MDLRIITTEPWSPVAPAELRANNRSWATNEDTLLATFVSAVTRYVEQRCQISILGRVLRLSLPNWTDGLELPAPPLRFAANAEPETAVTIQYRNSAGVLTAAPADLYRLSFKDQIWSLIRGADSLPALQDTPRAVQIDYSVGYRDQSHLSADAPDLRDVIMLLAASRDLNREATIMEPRALQVSRKIEFGVDEMLKPYRVMTRYGSMWSAVL
ncbi:MAG: hypothetical protein ACRCWF_17720 [Beijerinckiaceae bacterium]